MKPYSSIELPDALFNSQLNRTEPIQALLRFDTANFMEASMINSRLTTAWNFATPVQWKLTENTEVKPDFIISIQRSTKTLPNAQISPESDNPNTHSKY